MVLSRRRIFQHVDLDKEEQWQQEEEEDSDREKRDLSPVLCENDPLCASKFDRNPLADSGLLDRGDPARFLSLGGGLRRNLLTLTEGVDRRGTTETVLEERNKTLRASLGGGGLA